MKRLRSSLTLKIFILTLFLLLAISGITYASVAVFLPKTYRNSLEKDLASVSESLNPMLPLRKRKIFWSFSSGTIRLP